MSLSSLVLSQPLCEALSKKVNVPSVLEWQKSMGTWSVIEQRTGFLDTANLKMYIPAFTLGELPAVFKALGEVMGWPHSEDCDICDGETVGCFCIPTWQIKWMRFAQLYATNKEDAETYLLNLIK